jgi:hypothetical protein
MKRYLFFALSTLVIASSCQKDSLDNVDDTSPTGPDNPTNPTTPTLTISRPALDVGTISGFVDTFTVQSGIDWAITLSAGTETWLKLDTLKGGSGTTVVKLSVIANNTIATKTGTLTVSPVGSSTATPQVITLKQQLYTMLWQKAFTMTSSSDISDVLQDTDGGYVFAGSADVPGKNYNFGWVFKTDANGNKLWEAKTSNQSILWSMVKSPDGGYAATGWSFAVSPAGALQGQDLTVIKLNASGTIVWEKYFGGGGSERGLKILNTSDGGYLISGETESSDGDVSGNHGQYDLWLIKLDANGNKLWQKTYGGTGIDVKGTIAPTTDGGYLLTGYTNSSDGDITAGPGGGDLVVFKLDASGNKIWNKIYGGSKWESVASIIATKDGGSIIVGSTDSNDGDVSGNHSSDEDMWVLKLDNNGQKTWQATLGSTDWENGYSITQMTDGSYMALGFTYGNDGDVAGNHGDKDYWVVKLSNTGKKLWQRPFGGPDSDWPNAVTATSDSGFVVAGLAKGDGGDVTGINGVSKGWVVRCK